VNAFLISTQRMLQRYGADADYKSLVKGTYNPATDSVVNTETTTKIRTYKKSINVTQFNFPSLIGKDVAEFYVLGSAVVPKVNDSIVFGTDKYVIQQYKVHMIGPEATLYCLVAVKV
jgi:hypothetical protein